MANTNGPSRKEVYDALTDLRRENNLQYTAIAEFMGRSDACIQGNAKRLDEHRDELIAIQADLDKLRMVDKVWGGVNSAGVAIATALGLMNR